MTDNMSTVSTGALAKVKASNKASDPACLFTDKLPLEIRLEIYRYLVGRYTKQEVNFKSAEVGHGKSMTFLSITNAVHVYSTTCTATQS